MAKKLSALEKRCEDCIAVISKGGVMCCDEKWGKPCSEITDCPEGIDLEEIETINEKAKTIKVDHGAKNEDKSSKKPRERKLDEEKIHLINVFSTLLEGLEYVDTVKITNESKIIEFSIGENNYKLDLVKKRQSKS